LITAVVGGLVAVIGGLAATLWTKHLEMWKERMEFASALSGELETILGIMVKRDYLAGLEWTISRMQETRQMTPMQFSVRDSFFAVYLNNVAKIGILPSRLPAQISRIYGLLFSILEDIKYLNTLEWEKEYPEHTFDHVMNIQRNLVVWGHDLISEIESVLPRLRDISRDYGIFQA
jgi:hypothetical protein